MISAMAGNIFDREKIFYWIKAAKTSMIAEFEKCARVYRN